MPSCTFFGHGDCPDSIRPAVAKAIMQMVLQHKVDFFYVGNQGRFDQIVLSELRVLKSLDEIKDLFNYAVVLPYVPTKQPFYMRYLPEETMLPEGIETVHPKYAIVKRNNWMLDHSEHVIAFVIHSWGGAAQYVSKARQKQKHILHIVPNDIPSSQGDTTNLRSSQ